MEPINLGKLLKRIRKSRGLTIDQLATGICSSRNISYIESGKTIPNAYYLELILSKLNFSNTNDLLEFSAYKDPVYVYDIFNKFQELKTSNNFYELNKIILTLQDNEDFKHGRSKKFLDWHQGICLYTIHEDYATALELFNTCLSFDISELLTPNKGFYISKQEIEILNSYAICLSYTGNYKLAIDIMKAVDSFLSIEFPFKNSSTFHLKLLYNLTKTFMRTKSYSDALVFTNKGLALSLSNNSSEYLGQLYYQKADCNFNLGINTDITKNLVLAYNIFDMQKNEHLKQIIIDKAKGKFKVDINPYITFNE